jgi:hypothetical protein
VHSRVGIFWTVFFWIKVPSERPYWSAPFKNTGRAAIFYRKKSGNVVPFPESCQPPPARTTIHIVIDLFFHAKTRC